MPCAYWMCVKGQPSSWEVRVYERISFSVKNGIRERVWTSEHSLLVRLQRVSVRFAFLRNAIGRHLLLRWFSKNSEELLTINKYFTQWRLVVDIHRAAKLLSRLQQRSLASIFGFRNGSRPTNRKQVWFIDLSKRLVQFSVHINKVLLETSTRIIHSEVKITEIWEVPCCCRNFCRV